MSRPLTAVLVVLLRLVTTGHAQSPMHLSGSVLDATGLPLAAATVTLRGAVERVAETAVDGRFDFRNLPAGEYELTIAREAFSTARRIVRLAPGETPDLTVTLTLVMLEQTVVTASKTGETDAQTHADGGDRRWRARDSDGCRIARSSTSPVARRASPSRRTPGSRN